MNGNEGFRISPRLIVGLAIVALGVLWLFDNMGYIHAWHYTRYWPVVLIAIGLAKLTEPRSPKGGAIALIVIGGAFLGSMLTNFSFDFSDLFPLGLTLLGAKLVIDAMSRRRAASSANDPNSIVHAFALMAGVHLQNTSTEFRGGDANAIMGGVELDLRNAQIKDGEEAVLDTFALWGGVEVTVPENWRVVGQVMPLMGGFENKTRAAGPSGPVLIVKGTAVMGAVEVKN